MPEPEPIAVQASAAVSAAPCRRGIAGALVELLAREA